jgi:2-polyprenyl-3-methyl-5-hydroxy-6-metoxy-1,4-benzoquinol methylase
MKHFPKVTFACADIAAMPPSIPAGGYQVVTAVEVIEHLYAPRMLVDAAKVYLAPGGRLLLTTPYHGYWKNLAVAVTGKCDKHFNPLWDGGHVKFFSPSTLRKLLEQQGIGDVRFGFAGRFPGFRKSMVCSCRMNGTQPS